LSYLLPKINPEGAELFWTRTRLACSFPKKFGTR